MKIIATKHSVSLLLKTFQNPHKRIDTTIRTLEGRALSLKTLKISKEYAKGNFHMQRLKRASTATLSFKESLYVRAKLSI
ncbi:hypothetical protein [Bartonella tribocorum]|uniref:hypothetical protein n=1 Tax=Bartonella tribocorum TaxID=85701 RepID=UPI00030A0970|nr:hypothetical protein [Bartonella tribocorum]CDO49280.1 hypothetical protein BM1374166_01617 [Bartonella tribocorum]